MDDIKPLLSDFSFSISEKFKSILQQLLPSLLLLLKLMLLLFLGLTTLSPAKSYTYIVLLWPTTYGFS